MVCCVISSYLCSSLAEPLNRLLHSVTGVWNLEDFAGHLVAIVGACAAVYMGLVRLGHGVDDVRMYFHTWVTLPVTIGVALMQFTFALSTAGETETAEFQNLTGQGGWFAAYWLVKTALVTYLLLVAGRIVLRLRQYQRTAVLNLYLAAIAGTAFCFLLLAGHVTTAVDLHGAARLVGCVAMVLWSMTAAHSWRVKSRVDYTPDVAREDVADAAQEQRDAPFAQGD